MTYEPWQERLVEEQRHLALKLSALTSFIHADNPVFAALDKKDRCLLEDQQNAMWDYNDILKHRILRFAPETTF